MIYSYKYVSHDEDNLIHYVNDEYKEAESRGRESRGFSVYKRNFAQEIKKRKFAQNKKEEIFRYISISRNNKNI